VHCDIAIFCHPYYVQQRIALSIPCRDVIQPLFFFWRPCLLFSTSGPNSRWWDVTLVFQFMRLDSSKLFYFYLTPPRWSLVNIIKHFLKSLRYLCTNFLLSKSTFSACKTGCWHVCVKSVKCTSNISVLIICTCFCLIVHVSVFIVTIFWHCSAE